MVVPEPNPFPKSNLNENVAYGLRLQGVQNFQADLDEVVERPCVAALWAEVKDRLNEQRPLAVGGQQARLVHARRLRRAGSDSARRDGLGTDLSRR